MQCRSLSGILGCSTTIGSVDVRLDLLTAGLRVFAIPFLFLVFAKPQFDSDHVHGVFVTSCSMCVSCNANFIMVAACGGIAHILCKYWTSDCRPQVQNVELRCTGRSVVSGGSFSRQPSAAKPSEADPDDPLPGGCSRRSVLRDFLGLDRPAPRRGSACPV